MNLYTVITQCHLDIILFQVNGDSLRMRKIVLLFVIVYLDMIYYTIPPLDQSFYLIKLHYDLKSISPLLFESSIVIATFGFLSYEALAHGAPLCSIATKKFQSDYGDLLEDRGLAYNVGLVNNNSKKKLSKLIKKTLDDADNLSIQAKKLMDGNGIKRLANIIENYCKYE